MTTASQLRHLNAPSTSASDAFPTLYHRRSPFLSCEYAVQECFCHQANIIEYECDEIAKGAKQVRNGTLSQLRPGWLKMSLSQGHLCGRREPAVQRLLWLTQVP